jgi:hypothetical protein
MMGPNYFLLNPDDVDSSDGETAAERADSLIDEADDQEFYSLDVVSDSSGVARYYFYAACIPLNCYFANGDMVNTCNLASFFSDPATAGVTCSQVPSTILVTAGTASEEIDIPSVFSITNGTGE